MIYSGTLEHELEKYPVFKEGFEVVNRELDEKISELIVEKARMTEWKSDMSIQFEDF